ncbi:YIP1 family protein [Jannaschia ovalis]|uniref:YIP1 family protein n=1 Tax=Jannaschia ovalis TaxID=3038773 RepID=A0ABY8LBU7_9RHOB|nr:YIP1 family protein [Jannaschia sp. GRR-S6-38]WGH78806.1 YIP1 family protein [Jannaschia sp. GRR-S6-38]
MSVTTDIPRSWLRPRAVMAEHMARGTGDSTAFIFLMAGCLLLFVSRLPALSREAFLTGGDFMLATGGALMAIVFLLPLLMIGLAWIAHLVTRLFGSKGRAENARVATSWTLLAVSPAMLLNGLTEGFVGPGPALQLVGIVALGGFIWIWVNTLYVAEWEPEETHV